MKRWIPPNPVATLLPFLVLVAGCESAPEDAEAAFASTYQSLPSQPTVIRNATILTGTGRRVDGGDVFMQNGLVSAVGEDLSVPDDTLEIDGTGKWVTPGVIDVHSHLGNYPVFAVEATSDGNEITDPNTAQVWAEHSVWTQDPGFITALAGGVTTMQILPGSANLFGGRSVTLKNVPARTVQAMKFPGAPYGLKMACGENPKRVYGGMKDQAPSTRMGNVAGYRAAWIAAREYLDSQEGGGGDAGPTVRDLQLETLAGVLKGEILVHNHCYRGEEMAVMLDLAKEFGYKVGTFHHAVEAYKVADLLAESGTCAAMWADWWGFKLEAFDMVLENIALVDAAGACALIHSDSGISIQRLNQEVAKVMAAANRRGMNITREHAVSWFTLNPAKSLGVDKQTGSLEPGKMADVVLWTGDPFSVYALAEKVFIDGALTWDRNDERYQPQTDFELGLVDQEEALQ